ncbi:hypothetical protein Q3G72_021773 [Acer saccharum]|nr:hypothetical protein Q3G72_021773 [Acer saccharum]
MKEAVKVAKMVDEMHVYGLPISSKVAAYGWNGRRSTNVSRQNGENLAKKGRGDRTIKEGNRGDLKGENTGFRSFVKVVTGHRSKFKDTEKELENGPFFKPKNLQGERSKISNQHNSGSHSLPEIQLVVQLYGSKGDSENCGEALERSSGPGCSTSQNLWPN